MIEVSDLYKSKVYGQNRTFKMRLNLGVTNTEMDDNKESFTFSSSNSHGNLTYWPNVFDKRTSNVMNVATLETDRTLLDGSFVVCTTSDPASNQQALVGNNISNSDGSYTSKPSWTFTFDQAYDVTGFTITFNENEKEYATSFAINCYNSSGSSVYSETFTGNTGVTVAIAQEVLSMKAFSITVNSWCKANRMARINEIEWGVSQSFTNDQLVNLNIIEEFDPNCLESPETQISFTVDNGDNNFTIGNNQGFYKHLQSRQQVSVDLGLVLDDETQEIEYIPLGEFYIDKWDTDSTGLTASFEGCSLLDVMSTYNYVRPSSASMTAYNLIVYIFELCDSPNYTLDSSLKNYTINTNIRNDIDCKTALVSIANMCSCVVKMDRNGYVNVIPKATSEPVDTITFDEMYSYPTQTLNNLTGSVKVSYNADENYNYTTENSGKQLSITNEFLESGLEEYCKEIAETEDSIRLGLDVDWRGNPSLEIGDSVRVETPFNKMNFENLYNISPAVQPNGGQGWGISFEFNGCFHFAGFLNGAAADANIDYNLYRLNPEDNTVTIVARMTNSTGWGTQFNSEFLRKNENESLVYWFRTQGSAAGLWVATFNGSSWTYVVFCYPELCEMKRYQIGNVAHFVGGHPSGSNVLEKKHYIFDMSDNTFTAIDYEFNLYHRYTGAFEDNGKVYIIGGTEDSAFAESTYWEIYDGAEAKIWNTGISWNRAKAVKFGRLWYIFNQNTGYLTTAYIFNPNTLEINYIGEFTTDVQSSLLDPVLIGNKFYTIHNADSSININESIYVSDPLPESVILTKNEIKFAGYLKATSTFKTDH